jgi:phage tail-like protein
MPRREDDPLAGFNFLLESGGVLRAGFSEITGLNSENDVIEYRTGKDDMTNRKTPGLNKYGNVTLKGGVAAVAAADQDFIAWRQSVQTGDILRQEISIIVQDELKVEQVRYNLRNAWPSKWVGPDLKGGASEMAIEQLEIVHEGVTLG